VIHALALAAAAPRGAGLDPDAAAAFAAMSAPPDAKHAQAAETLIRGLKADGLWSLIDSLFLLAAHDPQAARVDIRKPTRVASAVNSPTFTVDEGYTFDGATNYLATGFNRGQNAVAMTVDSQSLWVYDRSNVAGNAVYSAGGGLSGVRRLILNGRGNTGGVMQGAAGGNGVLTIAVQADRRGLNGVSRTGANGNNRFYKNGALFEEVAGSTSETVLSDIETWIGCQNNSGSYANGYAGQVGAVIHAADLNDTQAAQLYVRVQAYMSALGANV
jgi:hypothetical protein